MKQGISIRLKQLHLGIRDAAHIMDSQRAGIFLIACILLIQVAVIAFWASQRSNYYIDELFSFGSAHSYTFDRKDIMYINRSQAWQYEQWVDNCDLKEQLEVTETESLLSQPPIDGIRMLLTRRNYHGILYLLMSFFSPGEVSAAPAVGFNLILFVLTQIVLYKIMKGLTGSTAVSILTIMMYGFSGMAISTVLYIRFYMLVTLLLLLLIRIHQRMWQMESLLRCELYTLLCMVLIYFAMKDSELVFVVGGALVTAYAFGLLIRKQFKKGILYIATVFPASLYYAIAKTSFLDIALHPEKYAQGNGAEAWMTAKLLTVNRDRVVSLIFKFLGWVSDLMFGSWYVLCSFVIIILILLEGRLLGQKGSETKDECNGKKGFVWVIASVCLIYYIFSLLVAIPAERYFMFYFPLLTILLWKMLYELMSGMEYRREVLICGFVLVCVGALALQLIRPEKIDFVYLEDRPLIQAVKDSGIEDVIIIYTDERDSNHSAYECINLMPDTAQLYPVESIDHQIDAGLCPDQVLVWIHYDRNPQTYLTDLLAAGYELEELGSTHASDVYIARKE